jgi:sugar lactone lactonase YvrE
MKNRFYTRHLILVAAGLLGAQFTTIPALRADLVNGQAALSVLGKPDYTNTTADGPTATEMENPEGIAIDPVTKKLFVADRGSNRVLRFTTRASYSTGAAAEAVFGQADFISGSANRGGAVAANTMNAPRSIHVDDAGRLWVADDSNNRVLRFDGASSKASGSNADAILGQSDFTSSATASTQAGMDSPTGVVTDAVGNLYVVDYDNNRVLIFYNAASKGNGANADRVLGQDNFVANSSGVSATRFSGPWGGTIDKDGRLWVADKDNNRLLRFDNVATIGNGAAASAVLGQANFVSFAAQPVSATSLNSPYYVAAAPDGTLWVGDYSYERVLGYKNAAGKANGGSADVVLGQPNFVTEGAGAASATSIGSANAVAVDSEGGLFVSDYNYDRVLRYSAVVKIKGPSRVTATGGKALLRGTSEHASFVRYKQPGAPLADARGRVSAWKVKLKGLTRPITRVRVKAVALDKRETTKFVKVINR